MGIRAITTGDLVVEDKTGTESTLPVVSGDTEKLTFVKVKDTSTASVHLLYGT